MGKRLETEIGSGGGPTRSARTARTRVEPPPEAFEQLRAARLELETYREETRVQTEQLIKFQSLLEKSRDRYADLFDFAPIPYLILDRWGVVIESNLPSAGLLGCERLKIVGFPLRRYIDPADRAIFLEHMRRCRREKGRVTSEVRFKTAYGATVPVELSSRRSLDRNDDGETYPTAAIDLSERQRANEERNGLLRQLIAAEEIERQRLSRELHDVLGQHITAISLGLQELNCPAGDVQHRAQIESLHSIIGELGEDVHRLALNLRPTSLDDLGLESALAGYLDDWSSRTGVRAHYHSSRRGGVRLKPEVETVLYRVAQEALSNVAKHAAARNVNLIVKTTAKEASMIVEDDGRGLDLEHVFQTAVERHRLGLRGMRERVGLFGGTLEIESALGRGTALFVRIPLRGSDETAGGGP